MVLEEAGSEGVFVSVSQLILPFHPEKLAVGVAVRPGSPPNSSVSYGHRHCKGLLLLLLLF